MTATEVKAKILGLLDAVADGEEIQITRRGKPIAKLVPASGSASLKGSLEGVAASNADDGELFTTGESWESA